MNLANIHVRRNLDKAIECAEKERPNFVAHYIREALFESAENVHSIQDFVEEAYRPILPLLLKGFNNACFSQDKYEFERYKKSLEDYQKLAGIKDLGEATLRIEYFLKNAEDLAEYGKRNEAKELVGFATSCATLTPTSNIHTRVDSIYKTCKTNKGKFYF